MTLFEAKEYDPARARKRRNLILLLIAVVLIGVTLFYHYRYWPEEHVVDKFFHALQNKQFEEAYAIWLHDPNWKQHPEKYKDYNYNNFYLDWGPGGDWGHIQSYRIEGAVTPPRHGATRITGVVVVVTVNQRIADKCHVWVEKKEKTLHFSPF